MTAPFTLEKCPHCFKENVAGTIVHAFENTAYTVSFLGFCNSCKKPLTCERNLVYLGNPSGHEIQNVISEINNRNSYFPDITKIIGDDWFPKQPTLDIPENIPDDVLVEFIKAEKLSTTPDMETPAGFQYRKTLEKSLKHFPQAKGKSPYHKIESLYNQQFFTESLKDFAHRIRTLGNSAVHDDDDISKEELNDLKIFTRLFLMYVFTLPSMIPVTNDDHNSTP